MFKLTCVSGYWKINNKHDNKYDEWFYKTLKIKAPYIFFTNKENIPFIKKYRGNLPTYYVIINITDFITYKFRNKIKTDQMHCPSIELNLIWNEKIFLLARAHKLNPYNSDFFCWVDAGIYIYRDQYPSKKIFPNLYKLSKLPTNKFIYSSSTNYEHNNVRNDNYYHHIAATAFILHKSIIKNFSKLYYIYLVKLLDLNNIWTEQVILTHIYKDYPHLFYKLCHGYGDIIKSLL